MQNSADGFLLPHHRKYLIRWAEILDTKNLTLFQKIIIATGGLFLGIFLYIIVGYIGVSIWGEDDFMNHLMPFLPIFAAILFFSWLYLLYKLSKRS